MSQDIYKDKEAITEIAIHKAKEHGCNYNIILFNPIDGEFGDGSTYEFVADSYFNKERPNVILLAKTDDLIEKTVLVSDGRKFDGFDEAIKELNEMEMVGKSGRGRTFSITGRGTVAKGLSNKDSYVQFNEADVEIIEEAKKYTRNWTTPFVRTEPKIGRNNPCPCDSGKKFKNCCITK